MGNGIPKIEYLNLSTTGDLTAESATVSNIATAGIEVGMAVRGAGIPSGVTVETLSIGSLTLSKQAMGTAAGVELEFAHVVEFEYPPADDGDEDLEASEQVSTSLSGARQVSVDHVIGVMRPEFSFLSQPIFEKLRTFVQNHGIFGRSFRYFPDKDESEFRTYELATFRFSPKKVVARGDNEYLWKVPLEMRRVI